MTDTSPGSGTDISSTQWSWRGQCFGLALVAYSLLGSMARIYFSASVCIAYQLEYPATDDDDVAMCVKFFLIFLFLLPVIQLWTYIAYGYYCSPFFSSWLLWRQGSVFYFYFSWGGVGSGW